MCVFVIVKALVRDESETKSFETYNKNQQISLNPQSL